MIEESFFIKHEYCVASEMKKLGIKRIDGEDYQDCSSSDGHAIYEYDKEDGSVGYSGYCFSCNQSFNVNSLAKSSLAEDLGLSAEGSVVEKKVFERKDKKQTVTKEEVKEILSYGYEGLGYRGIKDEFRKFFGHAIKVVDGKPVAEWYPETRDGKLTGYKSRHFPKNFGYDNKGLTGVKSDLSGQVKFKDKNFRDILLTGGEVDKVSAYQMWVENQRNKSKRKGIETDEYDYMPVVSGTTGEGSVVNQIRNNYDFICSAENIYIGLDNDEAGISAMEDICAILPKDKLKIIKWSRKDPNSYIHNPEGKDYSKQFISDFFAAKDYEDSGIFASSGLMPYIKEALKLDRIPLPDYMEGLQTMTKGSGLIKNRLYNLIGITSCGKSTHVNAMVHHFAFLPTEKCAVISLEATKGEYGVDILSLHLEKNLYWEEADNVIDYLDSPEVSEKAQELFIDEYGESRFYVVDDRKGTVASLEKLCETLRNKYGVTLIVIDVLTDLLRVTNNEEQAKHLNWQSNFVKSGVTIINVLHTRKLASSTNGVPIKATEYDAYGSSIFVQKAAGNIIINRNKEAPDDDWIEKNTTYVTVAKMRQGKTGDTVPWLYDPETRKSYDRNKFFEMYPDKLPQGYDLSISSFDRAYWEEGGRGWDGVADNTSKYKPSKPNRKQDQPVEDWSIEVEDGTIF